MAWRGRRAAVVLLMGAALLAGCGGDGADTGATPTPTSATTEDVEAVTPTPKPVTTEDVDEVTAGMSAVLSADCMAMLNRFAEAQMDYGAALGGAMLGEVPQLQEVVRNFDALVDAAPAEIRPAFAVMSEQVAAWTQAMAEIGLDEGAPPSAEQAAQLEALSEEMDNEALETAAAEIEAYMTERCGDLE